MVGPVSAGRDGVRHMTTRSKVIPGLYRDSVTLMQIAARIGALPGVAEATAMMATEANLALAEEAGLLEARPDAGPNDLLIIVAGDDENLLETAIDEAVAALDRAPRSLSASQTVEPKSVAMATAALPEANFALIATPGDYAGSEALKALRLGLNVMLFSDNVTTDDEIALKRLGAERGLMVMGPDCGTAIIDGVPLGFANEVRRGNIGIVAASGTGLQQVTCLIDRAGAGISQAVGTGGRDLSEAIGGATMLQGIAALAADPDTTVIALISKPPSPAVASWVLDAASACGKPVVANFLGADPAAISRERVVAADTLADAAAMAVAISNEKSPNALPASPDPEQVARGVNLGPGRQFVRALYSGGTFCYEALLLLGPLLGPVRSSTPLSAEHALDDPWTSQGHTAIDLGDDIFTRGRPHPMIDHRLRNERIAREAADPDCAVILLDVVLGHGAHPDPAAELSPVIARTGGADGPIFVVSVCGADRDPQGLARQESTLAEAGALLAPSNAAAVRLAAALIAGGKK